MIDKEWLYHFDDSGNIKKNDDILNAIPKLASLSDEWFKYYVLAYDYIRSPYKFRPVDEAKLMSSRMAFKQDSIPEEDPEVVRELKSVLYSEKHEIVVSLRTKINKLNHDLISEDDTKEITKYLGTINRLQEMMDDYMEQIKEKSEEIKIGKNKKLSLLEKLQRNKKLYSMKNQ